MKRITTFLFVVFVSINSLLGQIESKKNFLTQNAQTNKLYGFKKNYPQKKAKATQQVTFAYHKLSCEI